MTLASKAPKGFLPVSIYKGVVSQNQELIIAGFGLIENNRSSDHLYFKGVNIISVDTNRIKHTFGTCSGDSGGPSYFYRNGKYELVGVTATVFKETACEGAGFQTIAKNHSSWIEGTSCGTIAHGSTWIEESCSNGRTTTYHFKCQNGTKTILKSETANTYMCNI